MNRCKHATSYQGKQPPRCNEGKGCDACTIKWGSSENSAVRRAWRTKHEVRKPRITADFLFLDVKIGRAALRKLVGDRFEGPYTIPITIEGEIVDGRASGDDGVSQEFTVEVRAIVLGAPKPRERKCEDKAKDARERVHSGRGAAGPIRAPVGAREGCS